MSEVHSLALAATGSEAGEGLAASRRRSGRRQWTVDRRTVGGMRKGGSWRRRFIGGRGWSQGRAAMGAGKSAPLRGIPVL